MAMTRTVAKQPLTTTSKSVNADWGEIGDLVCAILHAVYRRHRKQFQREARKEGIAVEQLAAAAIAEAIRERLQVPDV